MVLPLKSEHKLDQAKHQSDLGKGGAFWDLAKLISRNWQLCLLAVLLMALARGAIQFVWSFPEVVSEKRDVFGTLFTVVSIYMLGYLFVTRLMLSERMTDHSWSWKRMLSFMGVGAFILVGATFCAVFATIPGINVFIRLSLVIPTAVVVIRCILAPCFVVGNQMKPAEAIKASWIITKGQGRTVFITLALMGTVIKIAALALDFFVGTQISAESASG